MLFPFFLLPALLAQSPAVKPLPPTATLGEIIRLLQTVKPKGEFETTADYLARRDQALMRVGGKRIFTLPLRAEYDADAETGHFRLSKKLAQRRFGGAWEEGQQCPEGFRGGNGIYYCEYETAHVQVKAATESSYTARNAFGVSTVVRKSVFEWYGLAMIGRERRDFYFDLPLKVAPTRLPLIKLDIEGEILSPTVFTELEDFTTPTVTEPIDLTVRGFYVAFKVDSVELVELPPAPPPRAR